ncbi:hypothetical protein GGI05_002076 [Coemansia sp. RSA 2603]|nr:hypothetical protein GGI05_002076 [Coemansia sp. RSA 2603]
MTDAPVAQQAMQTAERLARLSDVLTPAHVKQSQQLSGGGGKNDDAHDANSIESLLLNLANNEMQVQQQKIQAHMPAKTTRMKLLYEDHVRPDSAGRTSSLSSYNEPSKPAASSRPPIPHPRPTKQIPALPTQQPKPQHQKNSSLDMSLSQIGLWTPRTTNSQAITSASSSFASSIESMREATLRTEVLAANRSSGSMLFGPRGMPPSRASSRANDTQRSEHSTLRSPFTTVSSGFSAGSQSFGSMYSADTGSARSARVAHEAAISEARQMLDGIPSPEEHRGHEAEYLFDDFDEPQRTGKPQMISPASEASGRFVYNTSTVSSRESFEPNLPTASASVVSDASSGLGHESSTAELPTLHRSWYSSTDSIDVLGGSAQSTSQSSTLSQSAAQTPAVATERQAYAGSFASQYDVAGDVQRLLNISGSTQNLYAASTVDSRAASSLADASLVAGGYQQPVQWQQPVYVARSPSVAGYATPVQGYVVPGQMGYANVVPQQQGYVQAVYTGVDANGRPYSAYQQHPPQQLYPQQQQLYPQQQQLFPQQQQVQQQQYQQVPVAANGQSPQNYYDPAVSFAQQRPTSMAQTPDFASRPRSRTTGATSVAAPAPAQAAAVSAPTVAAAPVQAATGLAQTSSAKGLAIPSRQEQFGVQRPASYAGPSSLPSSAGRPQSPLMPEAALPPRASTPSGFGTLSSTPPATFAQRGSGSMSPFPSNVGAPQAGTHSATSSPMPGDAPKDMLFVGDLDARVTQPLPANVTPINFVKMARPVFKFGGHISQPEATNWSKVDRQMTMLKSVSAKLTVDVLATMHVGRPFNRPVERVRAAFFWIASNIQYDASVAESNEEFEQNEAPNSVLQRRRSRGPGYAYLFDAMMHALGIECTTVRGYLRQPLDNYHGAVLPADNHVWNAVCLDGEFRMVDTASAAKSHPLNAECKVDPWFFLASPKDLIFTHFPLAALDQFVDPVVPLPVFWSLPYVRPAFFSCKVKLLNLPHAPRIELRDDQVVPLVMCVRDASLAVFAEVELHDPNGSGRIVARQPLLAQCMDYRGKRMVKILVGVRAAEARGLVKIYCGTRVPLQPRRLADEPPPPSPGRAAQKKVLGFLNKDKRPSAHDYSRIKDVDEDGSIKTTATAKTYPLACILPVVHRGRNNAPVFVQVNAAIPNEFYIKEPTDGQFHLGESVSFHLLPVGEERLFHLQLRSPSGHQFKFVYQPSDQGYILRHAVKERGAWIIVYHTDTDGWLPIASFNCI